METTPGQSAAPTRSLAEWRARIQDAMGRGELLEAYDHAARAIEEYPDDLQLKYRAVLALARAGATRQARTHYDKFKLAHVPDAEPAFEVDLQSLDARIAKNAALEAIGSEREQLLGEAASRYEAIFRRTGDTYPGVNAATLSLLKGQTAQAESLARDVLARCEAQVVQGDGDSYYARATVAEAALVLGRLDDARAALESAAQLHGGDYSAVATTRRQLRMVCAARGIPDSILALLAAPAVIHFCGHMIGPRFPASAEGSVRGRIEETLGRWKVGFGYGSLAAGADIMVAEELLRRGAELNVAMPFDIEEFKRVSVAPAGEQWRARFETCFKAARTVTYATTDEYLGDDSLFGYASRIAIGLALLRARFLDTEARQVAVWDGAGVGGSDRTAGAAADVRVWRQHGLPEEIIKPLEGRQAGSARKPAAAKKKATSSKSNARSIKAMLFGDFHGFSKLREVQVPIFVSEMLGASARILDRQGKGVLFRNTWGDGLYLVMRDVETAANCALEMQETMASFDPASQGLPEDMRLRLGGHLGPVFRIRDPILKRQSFMGAHVSRTARIEPITPEGAVYVTEAFAAVLTSGTSKDFVCEYVGQLQTAKGYGIMRMYSLRRRATGRAVASAS